MDRTDFDLMQLLRKNARLSNKALADACEIAPSTALERVRRLEQTGAITGYHAEVSPQATGIGLQALVAVRLRRHARSEVDSFQAHLATLQEAVAFYHLAGADDFLVHVVARDSEHLRELLLASFTERAEVAHLETHLIFAFQRNTRLPDWAVR